jgi:hypothetical protein
MGLPWSQNDAGDDYAAQNNTETLPGTLADQIGLGDTDQDILINMNDEDKHDFQSIADYIEEKL